MSVTASHQQYIQSFSDVFEVPVVTLDFAAKLGEQKMKLDFYGMPDEWI